MCEPGNGNVANDFMNMLLTVITIRMVVWICHVVTFTDVVKELLGECTKNGHAISVVDGCSLIGVYETNRFPRRHGMFDPLGYPIFLHPFKNDDILAIIQGRKVVKMTIDINAWLNTFAGEASFRGFSQD